MIFGLNNIRWSFTKKYEEENDFTKKSRDIRSMSLKDLKDKILSQVGWIIYPPIIVFYY